MTSPETDNNEPAIEYVPVIDPADRTRAIVGGILIALAWIISAATTILLVVAWPTAQTTEDATETVLFGAAVAAVATWYIVRHFLD